MKKYILILLFFIFCISCTRDTTELSKVRFPIEPIIERPQLKIVNYFPYHFDTYEFPKDSMIIANVGTGNLEWAFYTNTPWLTFIPPFGVNDDTIIFNIDWNYFHSQGSYVGMIYFYTNVDSMRWPFFSEKINDDIQITLLYNYVSEFPDSNEVSGYICYASFSGKVVRYETHCQASSTFFYEFQLSPESHDTLIDAFNEIDFLNLMNAIPNPMSGIRYPCPSSDIRFRLNITDKFKTVYINLGQEPEKYPQGFMDFYNKIARILKGPY